MLRRRPTFKFVIHQIDYIEDIDHAVGVDIGNFQNGKRCITSLKFIIHEMNNIEDIHLPVAVDIAGNMPDQQNNSCQIEIP